MTDGVFGHSRQLSQNKLFDLNTPSMRKSCDKEKKTRKEKKLVNTSLAAKGPLAYRLQNPKWPPGAPKWPTGSGKVSTPRFLGVLSHFR